jgi:TIR domain
MANVFVSHRGADATTAERLAHEIRSQGHQVWLDVWEIQTGDSIVEKIEGGLEGASYLLLCYSAAGVLAPWFNREWMSALARQLNGQKIKILPVRLTGGEPPSILADIRYADLVQNWAGGVAELLRSIR